MAKFIKENLLIISVFITGACVLVVEVVAVRVLSPHFGNTIFTVSSVISVILLALSVGYYVGGKLADEHPTLKWFFSIILISGLAVIFFHFLSTIILPILSTSNSLIIGPLVSSIILFLLPALLLGTLSPYTVKLESMQYPERGVGSVSGKIFFWSTLGSISGSLLAGFVLIPHFGVDNIFIATGIILFMLGFAPLAFLGFSKKYLGQAVLLVAVFISATLFSVNSAEADVLYSKDGIYEKITVRDGIFEGRPTRFFSQDKSDSGAMFLDSKGPDDLAYGFSRYYSIYKVFKPEIKHALIIGGGAYSMPKALLASDEEVLVDVSEIEPSLFELSKKYFGMTDDPRLRNFTEDGRRLLRDADKKYDFIFSDVYYSLFSIPAHFTTVEFFTIAKEKLSPDGIFVANIIGDLSKKETSVVMSEMKTFQTVFPNSYFFAVDSLDKIGTQNIIFVGYNSDKKIDFNSPLVTQNKDKTISTLKEKMIDVNLIDLSSYPVLTDDFSPVEYLTAKMLYSQ